MTRDDRVATRRTWKRTQRQQQHLTARERCLLAVYDEALRRTDWRAPAASITKPRQKEQVA